MCFSRNRHIKRTTESEEKKLQVSILAAVALSLLLASCSLESATGGADAASGTYQEIETGYPLKQIAVSEGKRWALTADNEVLAAENGKEDFRCVRKIEGIYSGTDGFVNVCFVDAQTAYAAYFSEDERSVVVERTSDGGESWEQTSLVYGDYGEVCDAGSVYLSFFDDENGYIGVSYHGEDSYLYRTENAGAEWRSEKLPVQDESISYIDGYAPVFYGENGAGMIVLKAVGESASYRLFLTEDYGAAWKAAGELPLESVQGYAADGAGRFLFVDGMGKLYERVG